MAHKWEAARLSDPTRLALWREMHAARRFQEHGEGAGLIPHMIRITEGDIPTQPRNVAHLGLMASDFKSESFKGGVRFAAYPDRPVSEVCREYFDMCQLFVDDFLRDHAHMLPS
jgi:hypothetical protein